MDRRAAPAPRRSLLLVAALLLCSCAGVARANGVLRVRRRFVAGESPPEELRGHDARRHGRALAAVDLPLGGTGRTDSGGLYFTELGIGTPPRKFRMQVDTGSDLLWVNCVHCKDCPNESDSDEVREYNLSSSLTGRLVTCDQEFCIAEYGEIEGCTHGKLCTYVMRYGDGSSSSGYYVTDYVQYDQVTGDHQFNARITFGCGAQQSGGLSSLTSPIDGLIGFGPANVSIVSQLASSGKVRKTFAHCFDNVNGGGIFVIGDVVEPKVQTTPLTPNMPHYYVNLRSIEVGGELLQFPSHMFDTGERKAVIDSGTTLAYLPEAAYTPLMHAILSYQPNLTIESQNGFLCFPYVESVHRLESNAFQEKIKIGDHVERGREILVTGRLRLNNHVVLLLRSVDDGFPVVSFHFEKSLSLRVYPHEYLFQNTGDRWCVGWQENEIDRGGINDVILLGDLVLSNKLVIYDLEKNVIGWTEYNCSSSIKVQDHKAGEVYSISGHTISSAFRLEIGGLILLFMMSAMVHYMFIHV